MSIAGKSDTNISNPSNGQLLAYNGTSARWTNQAAPAGSTTTQPGFKKFDELEGVTDDEKIDALNARSYTTARQETIVFSDRTYTIKTPIKLHSGLRLIGGMQSPLLGFNRGTVINWVGPANSSVFVFLDDGVEQSGSQGYPNKYAPRDVSVSYMQFQGPNNTHFIKPESTLVQRVVLWYCQFHSCSWRNFASVWQGYSTGSVVSGQSYLENINGTAFNVGGGETSIFSQDTMSYVNQTIDAGVPMLRANGLSKSSIGRVHLAIHGKTPALRVEGGHNLTCNGLVIQPDEGKSINGAAIILSGGSATTITNCHLSRVATNPSAGWNGASNNKGWIHVSGGSQRTIRGNTFYRDGVVPASDYPLVYVADATNNSVKWDYNNYTGFDPVARVDQAASGSIVLAPDPSVQLV